MFRFAQLQRQAQQGSRGARVCSRWLSSLSFETFGEPKNILKIGESLSVDEPAAGQVKVALKASPVTYEDIRTLKGLSAHCSTIGVAGTYGVGSVSAIGFGVMGVSVSSQVFVASNSTGTWNSNVLLNAQEVFEIDSIDEIQAACLPEAAAAWALLHNYSSLSTGDVVIRSAEASALNSAIDQIAKAKGYVVVPASDADLVDSQFKDKVASKGTVKLAITSGTGKSARAMQSLTGSKGVLVTYNGTIAPLNDSFTGIEVPSMSLIFKDQSVCGFDFRSWVANSPVEASRAISESVQLMKDGKLKFSPVQFKIARYADAVDSAASGKSAVIEL